MQQWQLNGKLYEFADGLQVICLQDGGQWKACWRHRSRTNLLS